MMCIHIYIVHSSEHCVHNVTRDIDIECIVQNIVFFNVDPTGQSPSKVNTGVSHSVNVCIMYLHAVRHL